ncbi:MAG: transposase [Nitrospiria bacterium]
MSRPLRIEFPGAVYHVTNRGNARQNIFSNDEDRRQFLSILEKTVNRYSWLCHAYCLMHDHYHLLIETQKPNLSLGMRQLNGLYTQTHNRSHNRIGHLFQGRFKSILLEKDTWLLPMCRYVVLNPVRSKIIDHPLAWEWSSYRATATGRDILPFLTLTWIFEQFGGELPEAHKKYRKYVAEGKTLPSPLEKRKGRIYLGSQAFIENHVPELISKEVSRVQSQDFRPTLKKIFENESEEGQAIFKAYRQHAYRLSEIANHLDVHYSTISRRLKNIESTF